MDLDGDGRRDVLSGSWPGELFLFRGGKDGAFLSPEKLKDRDGRSINIGGGIRPEGFREGLLVAGDVATEQRDGKTVWIYEGKVLDVPAGKSVATTGTASSVQAADFDGDGDLDLVVGDIGGSVYLVPNEGTARAWAFGPHRPLLAGGSPVKVAGDAGPCVADWDGDGRPDLLVGAGDGSVALFRNFGKEKGVVLEAGRVLVPPCGKAGGETVRPGMRAKVAVADWNADGRPDLLLGDFSSGAEREYHGWVWLYARKAVPAPDAAR